MLEALRGERRAIRVRLGGEQRWIDAADAGLYRDALGAVPPGGLPEAFLEDVPDALMRVVRRYAATHGPFTGAELRERYGVDCGAVLIALERDGELVQGELRPGGSGREWCHREVLRRLRRASLAALRKEVEPVEASALARFLPSWQGVDRHPPAGAGVDRLRDVLVPAAGTGAAGGGLGARGAAAAHRRLLTGLDGSAVRRRRGRLDRRRRARALGRVALYFREEVPLLGRRRRPASRPTDRCTRPCANGSARGAAFFTDLLVDVGSEIKATELQEALWDLVWAGEVTNDAFAPLRAPRLSVAREQARWPAGHRAVQDRVSVRGRVGAPPRSRFRAGGR